MSVNNEIKEISKEIKEALSNEEYEESVKLCTELIELLKKNNKQMRKSVLWYAHYSRGNSYYRLEQYEKALLDVEKSFYYVGKVDRLNDKYTFSLWLVASIESKIGKKEGALEKYKMLAKIYREMGYANLKLASIYNIAELLNKPNKMVMLRKIASNYEKLSSNSTNLTKKELINRMKENKKENK